MLDPFIPRNPRLRLKEVNNMMRKEKGIQRLYDGQYSSVSKTSILYPRSLLAHHGTNIDHHRQIINNNVKRMRDTRSEEE